MPLEKLALNTSISKVPLIGPAYARRMENLEIRTVSDLLYHLPSRFDDFSLLAKANSLQEGETVTIFGTVLSIKNIFTRNGFMLQQAEVEDDSGTCEVMWFNQRFITSVIKRGDRVSLSGKVGRSSKSKVQLQNPAFEVLHPGQKPIHTGRLVPIYPETQGISSKWLRSRINKVLELITSGNLEIKEFLDTDVLQENHLMGLQEALFQVHFPDSLERAAKAKERLAFNELLLSQLESKRRRQDWQKQTVGSIFKIIEFKEKLDSFVTSLPFELTGAQQKVISEIFSDLGKNTPMNRLLQGDVGSGKTVVAALGMLVAKLNGFQSVLMAPTEILAQQHYLTLTQLFKPLGLGVGIATGSLKDFENYDIIVGTHALLSDKISYKKLGFIVIDEQHRFGVGQRSLLAQKGTNPHILTMTATPIPRTVALTLYGDLDLSVLNEMPKNRLPITTWVVPREKRDKAYEWIVSQKTQAFIVCPLIEQSEAETLQSVKSVKKEYERLLEIFPQMKLGLLHGQMSAKEKDKVLTNFKVGKLDILVTTPVVEVGIDIPGATIMMIEAADRFGLAQLHQLRGRVGRGGRKSYCLLFTENPAPAATARLKFMERLTDGMALAEADLRFRGPGQRFGQAQHGRWNLKIATFDDLALVEKTNVLSQKVLASPELFPLLHNRVTENTILIAQN